MELNLQRQNITINEAVFDGFVEQPIECDALLPDYCPDIVKVLKCTVSTHIGSSTISGDRLTVEGTAIAHVFYTSADGGIRHAEFKIPFAKTVDLRSAPTDPIITVTPSVDYVNCRAVNQRRIDIRGALSMVIKVMDRAHQEVISDAEGAGLQLRRDMVQATDIVGQVQCPFNITEDLELGMGKQPIASIVRSDCRVNLQDYKVVAGKVVIKGDFLLHVLYAPQGEANALEVMEYALPISQIIDCEGVTEDCQCDVQLVVASCDVQPKLDESGEYTMIALDAKIMADIVAHQHMEVPVASDCYSTMYECGCKRKMVQFIRLVDVVREVIMHKATLDLPEEVDSVLDVWCEVDNVSHKQVEGGLEVTLRLTVSMFARMQDGSNMYFEQSTDLLQQIPVDTTCPELIFEPSADILSSSYTMVGRDKIDIRCEVLVRGCVYCSIKQNAIADITVDEQKEKQKDPSKLIIYYADPGESVWDIAKHYNTSANAIWEENAVEQDILSDKKMLLIPIV